MQTEINDRLSDEILFGDLAKGGTVEVDIEDGAPAFSCTPR